MDSIPQKNPCHLTPDLGRGVAMQQLCSTVTLPLEGPMTSSCEGGFFLLTALHTLICTGLHAGQQVPQLVNYNLLCVERALTLYSTLTGYLPEENALAGGSLCQLGSELWQQFMMQDAAGGHDAPVEESSQQNIPVSSPAPLSPTFGLTTREDEEVEADSKTVLQAPTHHLTHDVSLPSLTSTEAQGASATHHLSHSMGLPCLTTTHAQGTSPDSLAGLSPPQKKDLLEDDADAQRRTTRERRDGLQHRVTELRKENRRLKARQTCRQCGTRPISLTLLPCGHLCLCTECGPSLDHCPLCGRVIMADVRTFL
ncbi:hypothetical protein ACOMHN_041812 [Nucella lapillus]